MDRDTLLSVDRMSKSFTLHEQGVSREVLRDASLTVRAGECLSLDGRSGSGKSTLLRIIYGNYRASEGHVWVRHRGEPVDLAHACPWTLMEVRRESIGYISQFLRILPRISAVDVVAEPLAREGVAEAEARDRAEAMLAAVGLPTALWNLSPLTFSGGEQQRVNIARGFIKPYPLMLIDEPTASLDMSNKQIAIEIMRQSLACGTAIVGIFHDEIARDRLATARFDVEACSVWN